MPPTKGVDNRSRGIVTRHAQALSLAHPGHVPGSTCYRFEIPSIILDNDYKMIFIYHLSLFRVRRRDVGLFDKQRRRRSRERLTESRRSKFQANTPILEIIGNNKKRIS